MEPISTVPPLNQRQLRTTVCHAYFPRVIRIDEPSAYSEVVRRHLRYLSRREKSIYRAQFYGKRNADAKVQGESSSIA